MKEPPILFTPQNVRAILDGRKTQTRRIVKAKHVPLMENLLGGFLDGKWNQRPLPYGKPGDRLWVRETWGYFGGDEYLYQQDRASVGYRADWDGLSPVPGKKWRPSIHMPKWACRLWLELTDMRVERLGEITEQDAQAEGVTSLDQFIELWKSINQTWEPSLLVWVLTFKKV